MLNNKNNQGFTLIELMIALVVFTIGLTAALSLAMSNYNHSRDNLDKIIAANLAREGIELIRNVRDSNWLRMDLNESVDGNLCTWSTGLTIQNNGFVYIDYNDSFPSSFYTTCSWSNLQCPAECTDCELYKNTDGYYNHDTGDPTKYLRAIKLEKICVDEGASNPEKNESIEDINISCPSGTFIGIRISSQVQWEDNGTKSIEITDKLYNWRS